MQTSSRSPVSDSDAKSVKLRTPGRALRLIRRPRSNAAPATPGVPPALTLTTPTSLRNAVVAPLAAAWSCPAAASLADRRPAHAAILPPPATRPAVSSPQPAAANASAVMLASRHADVFSSPVLKLTRSTEMFVGRLLFPSRSRGRPSPAAVMGSAASRPAPVTTWQTPASNAPGSTKALRTITGETSNLVETPLRVESMTKLSVMDRFWSMCGRARSYSHPRSDLSDSSHRNASRSSSNSSAILSRAKTFRSSRCEASRPTWNPRSASAWPRLAGSTT